MQTKFEVLGINGIASVHQIDLDPTPSFAQLSTIVNPFLQVKGKPEAFLEHVRVLYEGEYVSMFVDDMGALKKLPVNKAATHIYHANLLSRSPAGIDTRDWPKIHGVAVLFDRNVWF